MKFACIADDVQLGENVKLGKFINLYGCTIRDNTKIGAFVEIQKNAQVGRNCKIQSHTFICEGVTIGEEAIVSAGSVVTKDVPARSTVAGNPAKTIRKTG